MIGSSLIAFYFLNVIVFGKIDKTAVNSAFEFHREGLLASASSEAEALSDAIFFFERAVRLQPRNATMWHDLGVAHLRSENWENADDCFLASMELSEKKMSRGGSGAATRRALSIHKSAMNNREEIVMFLDAINTNRNLFTESSSGSGSTGGGVSSVDKFKFTRSYSRLLSGRSVGVANGLVDEFNDDDDINDEDTDNEDDGNNSESLLSCLRKEQLESYSLHSSSPLISVIPAALLFSSPDLFLDHQFIPTLIHLNELDSWRILRRRKVDDSSRNGRWWQAWTPSYLAKHYGHLIVSTRVGSVYKVNTTCSTERLIKHVSTSSSSSSPPPPSLSIIRMTLVEASDETDILTRMALLHNSTMKSTEESIMSSTPPTLPVLKSRLLRRLGFPSSIQAMLMNKEFDDDEKNDDGNGKKTQTLRQTMIPSVIMDAGLPLDEWSHMTLELGKLPPLLGRDRDDKVLSCLIRISLPTETFERFDFSSLSAATLPIVSEFIIWAKWRRLTIVTLGGNSALIGQSDKEEEEDNNVHAWQKKERTLGEWHLQIAGISRWTLCRHDQEYNSLDQRDNLSLDCVKTLVTSGDLLYIPPAWIESSSMMTEPPFASIFLSGRVFIDNVIQGKKEEGGLRSELKRLEMMCRREMRVDYFPRVSESVCQLLYRASRSC